mmetsp:Transcript_74772/g.150428  ORF Transcript_74772/g.150428 Transcript_74772/m.150428 type:complete len:234 (+) Transcript_74772:51-752(+)
MMMMRLVAATITLSALLPFAHSDEISPVFNHQVQGRVAFGNGVPISSSKVTLNGGEYEAITRFDGSFTFHDIKPGIHLLDVLSPVGFFSQVKVNLPSDPEGKVKCLEYKYPGAPKQAIAYPLELQPHFKLQYFEARPKVSVMRMIMGNPMMLMMGVMALLFTVFPKIMGGDAMKEFQDQQAEMQAQMGDASNPMEMFSKILSGDIGQPPPAKEAPRVQAASGSTKRSKRQQNS